MRTKTSLTALGVTLLASPAFADAGAHHSEGLTHFLLQHGWAAAILATAIVAGGFYLAKRKG